jgi:hypothetical protein
VETRDLTSKLYQAVSHAMTCKSVESKQCFTNDNPMFDLTSLAHIKPCVILSHHNFVFGPMLIHLVDLFPSTDNRLVVDDVE